MRRFVFIFLLLMLILAGCKMEQSADSNGDATSVKTPYSSDTSTEDCYLCGGGIENLIPSYYWGQNNIALISLNTFEIKPLEINRYDRVDGRLVEEYVGAVSFGGSGSKDGGFAATLLLNYDRGYATGHVVFYDDEVLDVSKAAGFLCEKLYQ